MLMQFAMAELLYGTGKEHDNLMVIKWGPGVGCAIIIDQEIYEGRHAKAANWVILLLKKMEHYVNVDDMAVWKQRCLIVHFVK